MARLTGAQTLVRSLVQEGVEVIFGLPGVQIMNVLDTLYDEPKIRWVTVRHEQTAVYMADGYARTTGKVGVALVVPGPGMLNAAAAVGTAFATSSPVLLISGQIDRASLGKNRGALHEVENQVDVFKDLTKWRTQVLEVGQIPRAVHDAMHHARSGRPRPVYLEIPSDVLPDTTDVDLPGPAEISKKAPDPALVREAAALLVHAQWPAIWAGSGVKAAGAHAELTQLAEALAAPVIVTTNGKGAIVESHPQYAGPDYYGHGSGSQTMSRADVILAAGSRLLSFGRAPWPFQPHQRLIRIDADPDEIGRNWPEKVSICADARLALRALCAELEGKVAASQWSRSEIAQSRNSAYQRAKQSAPIQVEIVETLRRELDDDAIVVAGVNSIAYWSHLTFPVLAPGAYVTSGYFATLGYAFPTALGAKVGNPDRQVVALSGDGGFMYALPELATAVQEGIHVVTLVFNDGAYGASINDQRLRFGGRIIGTKVHTPDFARLAQSFGAEGVRLEEVGQLGNALKGALRGSSPMVIEVPIETWTPPFQMPPPGMS